MISAIRPVLGQTLPVPALCMMLPDGAARFGRRTPEPHVWPAAPSALARGDGWRGAAGMTDENKKSWLNSLGPVLRVLANRILGQHGESPFSQISKAYVSHGASKGAPRKPLPERWIAEGYRLWLLSEKDTYEEIAAKIINADMYIHANDRAGRVRALIGALGKGIKEREQTSKNLTVQGMKERYRSPDFWTKIELDLAIPENRIVRECVARSLYVSVADQLQKISKKNNSDASTSSYQLPGDSSIHRRILELKNKEIEKYRNEKALHKTLMQDVAFFEAFSDIIPDELPTTLADQWRAACIEFLQAEAERWKQTTKNS